MNEWERCGPWIQAALDHGGNLFSLDDVLEAIQIGQAQFWPGKNCALITELKKYPQKKICNVWLAGGDLEEIKHIVTYIRLFAKQTDCDAITLQGRPGWQKIYKQRLKAVTLMEEVSK
ncbi:MAG: hypothetical protein EBR82_40755 [Caulobacteraceae bacterium]|nr:hypothetical protein [Caulobacteraceae bacterium]